MPKYKITNKEYSIEEYSPQWEGKFHMIKKQLESLLGDKIIQIEHVGSTSIGIKSKPIIDVLVIVSDINGVHLEIVEAKKACYEWKENYISDDSFFLYKDVDGKRLENIHIFPVGHAQVTELLDKRNYLRAHPKEAKRYETIKIELAKKFPNDYISNRKGKDAYLNNELVEKIKKWEGRK